MGGFPTTAETLTPTLTERAARWASPRVKSEPIACNQRARNDRVTDAELTALYEQYGYLVHRRCLQLTGNASDAEDALQETFLRVRRFGAKPTTSPLAWLYTIASHCAFDLMNKKKREQPEAPEKLADLDHRTSGDADEGDRRALVGSVLRELDERTRTIGVLHFVDGYTQEEVAERTGISRKTVGKKLKLFESIFRSRAS